MNTPDDRDFLQRLTENMVLMTDYHRGLHLVNVDILEEVAMGRITRTSLVPRGGRRGAFGLYQACYLGGMVSHKTGRVRLLPNLGSLAEHGSAGASPSPGVILNSSEESRAVRDICAFDNGILNCVQHPIM